MTRKIIVSVIILAFCAGYAYDCSAQGAGNYSVISKHGPDSVKTRQLIYNGISWTNKYHRIDGDQFLFSEMFLPGKVSMNGMTITDVRIKYDIYSDEIITPLNRETIIQLNKEMVDSFAIFFENKTYRFIKVQRDTLKDFKGYVNLVYDGKTPFYLKYRKFISQSSTLRSDGHFLQKQIMFLAKDNLIRKVDDSKSFFIALRQEKDQLKEYIKRNRIKVSRKFPESFVPVLRFYDNIIK